MRIHIRAPYERIFELAQRIERWPERLPHYRYVRQVRDAGGERRFAMGARRGPIPVRWEAIQRPIPEDRRIEFVHTGGLTRGMQVEWRFRPIGDAWDVSIHHQLDLRWPLIGRLVADRIIGPIFVNGIARRTLWRIKLLAEAKP